MHKYEIIIFWSEADRAYVADVPELPGCMAHGSSYRQALEAAEQAMALWLEAAAESGCAIPAPRGERLIFA